MMNVKIRQFEDGILNMINESDLPIEVKRLVVADIFNLVLKQSDKEVANEILSAKAEENINEQGA